MPATVIAASSGAFFTDLIRVDTVTSATTRIGTVYSHLGDIATVTSGNLYGIRNNGLNSGQIVKLGPIPAAQGQGFVSTTVVAESPLLADGTALTSDPSGNLLAVTNGEMLVRINTNTGSVNSIGLLRSATGQVLGILSTGYENDLAYGPDGSLYFAGGALFRVNTNSGVVTQVGPLFPGFATLISGLVVSNGELLGFAGSSLVSINVQTGSITSIRSTYYGINGASSDPVTVAPRTDVVVDSVSTTDSRSLTVTYHVDNAPIHGPLTIGLYRSSDAGYSAEDSELASMILLDVATGTHT